MALQTPQFTLSKALARLRSLPTTQLLRTRLMAAAWRGNAGERQVFLFSRMLSMNEITVVPDQPSEAADFALPSSQSAISAISAIRRRRYRLEEWAVAARRRGGSKASTWRSVVEDVISGSWRLLVAVLVGLGLNACAVLREFAPAVAIQPIAPGEYIALQRGDVLTTGRLSALTAQTIRVAGLDLGPCASATSAACIAALADVDGLSDERRLSSLAEVWLHKAMSESAVAGRVSGADAAADTLAPWMEATRLAYAYLFFTERVPGERAFEDRQTQVRDWYNYAVQQVASLLFEMRRTHPEVVGEDDTLTRLGEWTFHIDQRVRLPQGIDWPQELLPASSLAFQGLRSIYRRDGFGAELVAVMEQDQVTVVQETDSNSSSPADKPPGRRRSRAALPPAWSEMPSPNMTLVMRFAGHGIEELLRTREAWISVHDPLAERALTLHGQRVPLAGNFTAGYGLWLARSGFNRQSLRSLLGREHGIDRPHLYMMQPFDPDRRIILMLHGLASSPEAWVNVANEILGDEQLRGAFQVWQVYYPTNMPIALKRQCHRGW